MANVQQTALHPTNFSGYGKRWTTTSVLASLGLAVFRVLDTWYQRSAERQQLASMSEFHLKDVGISRVEANQEAAKPFWRA